MLLVLVTQTSSTRILDRELIGDEETSLDEEEEDGFLKAFKVNNMLAVRLTLCSVIRSQIAYEKASSADLRVCKFTACLLYVKS